MKIKYVILKNTVTNILIIKEYAELDKAIYSLVCEVKYDCQVFQQAFNSGAKTDDIISLFRKNFFYPPAIYASSIADALKEAFLSEDDKPISVEFNDMDLFVKTPAPEEITQKNDKDDIVEIDKALEDDDIVKIDKPLEDGIDIDKVKGDKTLEDGIDIDKVKGDKPLEDGIDIEIDTENAAVEIKSVTKSTDD